MPLYWNKAVPNCLKENLRFTMATKKTAVKKAVKKAAKKAAPKKAAKKVAKKTATKKKK